MSESLHACRLTAFYWSCNRLGIWGDFPREVIVRCAVLIEGKNNKFKINYQYDSYKGRLY